MARDLGWDDSDAAYLAARHLASMGPSTAPGLAEHEFDMLVDAADDAETFLNVITPDGYSWGWHDGEFFLQSAEWWEEETY